MQCGQCIGKLSDDASCDRRRERASCVNEHLMEINGQPL
ncbi:hypothetical protein D187_005342 [Cystobacter fuscus DSM 2262]|uniref:Uncharacterized protein n=1 Tax=Cystobacter fuscus (strain ATCC 25194 / DSM 2262 / NBRC 100088 / M29) TaxID=1242864 RepID=S9R5H2_CYSF2|nr:hypothetical protein D187_005342 [Cystobacter fuscus DSM 2262]